MPAFIFDGKAFAAGMLKRVADETAVLGKPLKLATIYNSQNEAASTYTRIKARTADGIGILFEAYDLTDFKRGMETIKALNKDDEVQGIMVQLPFADKWGDERLCREIDKEKDVDGLNPGSGIVPATVQAVTAIVQEGLEKTGKSGSWPLLLAITGSRGNIGRRIMKEFEEDIRFRVMGMDKGDLKKEKLIQADVVVSVMGQPGLIGPEMIKPGAILVDVGYPGGDMKKEVGEVAGFWTPVPGGVGPVTVAMLFKNLMELAWKK